VTEPIVRHGHRAESEQIAALLRQSAGDMYDRFVGGRERALRLLVRALREAGNAASSDVVWVAELDGRVAGTLAGFPVGEAPARARALLRLILGEASPARWPSALWLYWAGGRAAPSPPATAFYVDALATAPARRRRGVARALLDEAERQARELGLPSVALDTTLPNKPARALYASAGFDEVAYRPPSRGLPGFVALVKPLAPAPATSRAPSSASTTCST
jgi:ribosomal protein S18 acetylase RimI-like enzyme